MGARTGSLLRKRRYTLVQLLMAGAESPASALEAERRGRAELDRMTAEIEDRLENNQPIPNLDQNEDKDNEHHT